MIPIIASVLLSVAGQLGYKLFSSFVLKDKDPTEALRSTQPLQKFAAVLDRARDGSPEPPTMSDPPLDAAGPPIARSPAVSAQSAALNVQSGVDAYRQMQSTQAP